MDINDPEPSETDRTRPPSEKNLWSRLLEWLARGAEKAARDGKSCNT